MRQIIVASPRNRRTLGLRAYFIKGVEGPSIARSHAVGILRWRADGNLRFLRPQSGAFS